MYCKRASILLAAILVGLTVAARAETIALMAVGDRDNAADTRVMNDGTSGYGAVSYIYQIGKYEVTAGQYTAFLNAVGRVDTHGLYAADMARTDYGSGITRTGDGTESVPYTYSVAASFVDRPVNYVSYWDACRFANWLHNNQPNGPQGVGTTETGAYTLTNDGMTNNTIVRNTDWKWAVTNEDEWYKAAYYKGGNADAGYWLYPTRSDEAPGRDMADASGNNANYWVSAGAYPIDSGKYTTLNNEFQGSASPYGTFNQGGNVWEWNEAIQFRSLRGLRGGSFYYYSFSLASTYRDINPPARDDFYDIGFRVVSSIPVPEPGSLAMSAAIAGMGLLCWRRRRG